MTLDKIKNIKDKLNSYVKNIDLIGRGEIFLHNNIYEVINSFEPIGINIHTNGTIEFNNLNINNINSIIFELNSFDKQTYEINKHDEFSNINENIKKILYLKKTRSYNINIIINITLSKQNENQLDQIISFYNNLGIDQITISPLNINNISKKNIEIFIPTSTNFNINKIINYDVDSGYIRLAEDVQSPYCINPFKYIYIDINGNVSPCNFSIDIMGNIFEQDLQEIFSSNKYKNFRLNVLTNRFKIDICKKCTEYHNNFGNLFNNTELSYDN
jgi:radical SAM protein with 4Fe4S-binding SPASM domain